MQVSIIDGQGVPQTVLMPGVEAPTDLSAAIAQSAVSQEAIPANPLRSGYFIQNVGAAVMYINERGVAASAAVVAGVGSYKLAVGASWPPPGYPVTADAVNILGTIADHFVAREW